MLTNCQHCRLKPADSANSGWEGSVCSRFLPPVHNHHTYKSSVTPQPLLHVWGFQQWNLLCHEDYCSWKSFWHRTLNQHFASVLWLEAVRCQWWKSATPDQEQHHQGLNLQPLDPKSGTITAPPQHTLRVGLSKAAICLVPGDVHVQVFLRHAWAHLGQGGLKVLHGDGWYLINDKHSHYNNKKKKNENW